MSMPSNPTPDPSLNLVGPVEIDNLHVDWDDEDEPSAEEEAAWAAEIDRRVAEIRSGTGKFSGIDEVLAELEHLEAEWAQYPLEAPADDEEDDLAEVEAAWEDEIKRRVDEIRNGTVKTYAAEDVLAALRLRFG
jgi:Putative addiction module component